MASETGRSSSGQGRNFASKGTLLDGNTRTAARAAEKEKPAQRLFIKKETAGSPSD